MHRSLPLVVLAPNFPPAVCGVGDHTAHLLRAWPADDPREIRCLLRPPPVAGAETAPTLSLPGAAVPVRDVTPSRRALLEMLAALGPCDLLVQYSAYGYDPRWGCPTGLCAACADWAHTGGGRLVVMFHELWVDNWPWWHPHRRVQAWHRRAIGQLARAATRIFTTTALSAARLRTLLGADRPERVAVLPAGSNIPAPAREKIFPPAVAASTDTATPPGRERGLFVLFGLQGTRLRCLRALREELRALARAGRLQRLVLLGLDQGAALTRAEAALLRETLPAPADFQSLGERPAAEISAWLQRAEFGLSEQTEANFTKSGTLMAYFAHGLNVLSPHAAAGRPAPFCWLTRADELLLPKAESDASAPITSPDFPSRARALRGWYENHAAWPLLAAEYARSLA